MKKQIPNIITSFNLLSGLIAIYLSFQGMLIEAAAFMALGAFFDFFDGMAARALNVKSEMGLQMDSLADMVSFGVAPGFIMFQLLQNSPNIPVWLIANTNMAAFPAFIIPVLSAFRLAKFNVDTRQTESFIGLPTPANSLFIGSLPFIISGTFAHQLLWLNNYYLLLALSILLAVLLVVELPLMSLKFKNLSWKDNSKRLIFLFISLVLLVSIHIAAFPLIIVVYILMSLFK
jgi:CDP-diacylglycerol--serine O-phosphatidyltransferase